jgi:hypothetical protein
MLYSTTPGSEAASEKLLRASTGLGDVLESIFGSFSNPSTGTSPTRSTARSRPPTPSRKRRSWSGTSSGRRRRPRRSATLWACNGTAP